MIPHSTYVSYTAIGNDLQFLPMTDIDDTYESHGHSVVVIPVHTRRTSKPKPERLFPGFYRLQRPDHRYLKIEIKQKDWQCVTVSIKNRMLTNALSFLGINNFLEVDDIL